MAETILELKKWKQIKRIIKRIKTFLEIEKIKKKMKMKMKEWINQNNFIYLDICLQVEWILEVLTKKIKQE